MRTFEYNYGKKCTGLYIDIRGTGQAYNVLLFIKKMGGRSKTGTISFSSKKHKGSIKFIRQHSSGIDWYYWVADYQNVKLLYPGITIPYFATTAKVIYVSVKPNKRL